MEDAREGGDRPP